MIAAIILAAGASQRMGRPKALLQIRGETFLEAVLDVCRASGINRRIVVVGPDTDKLLANIDLAGCTVVQNLAPETGPIGSIRIALNAIVNHPVEAVMVWHVDQPHVTVSTVTALIDRFRQRGPEIVVPEFDGRRGHPVIFGRAVFAELLGAPDDEGARTVVRANPDRIAVVRVDDRAVIEDVDTPEAYEALLRRLASGDTSPPRSGDA